MSDRDLDVVVFGATGVTGRNVAAYLAERARETGLRWAAAARNGDRLKRVLEEVGVDAPETIVADVGDRESLAALAGRALVVLNLAGPYTLYGRPVIEACVEQGAHYVDLSGEIPFVRGIIDDFHERATSAGVKIVQVCGFESLPPDLLVALARERAQRRFDEGLSSVDVEVAITPPPGLPRPSDGVSGGTFQSLSAVAGAEGAEIIADPAALIDDPVFADAVRARSPIALNPRRGSDGAVIAPMAPAAFINPAVIHRSAALLAADRGIDGSSAARGEADARGATSPAPFRYREGVVLGGSPATLPARWALAGVLSATQVGVRAVARAAPSVRAPIARALARLGPGSGFGPAADRLEGWRWTMRASARTQAGRSLDVRLEADGHPGYLATARLLGEVGMLLADDPAVSEGGGCLTPAAALGTGSVGRFARARVRFEADA